MMKTRPIWYDARNLKDEKSTLPFVLTSPIDYVLFSKAQVKNINLPKKTQVIIEIHKMDDIKELPKENIVLSHDMKLLEDVKNLGYQTALYRKIVPETDLESVWQEGLTFNYLVVELTDETNIPLELLIARLQDKSTDLIKVVKNYQDMEVSIGVMEVGSDGVLLKTEDIQELVKVNDYITNSKQSSIKMTKGKVVEVEHIGMGSRACIDTTDLLKTNEGMIVGSTSSGGLLVSSETHFLPYMDLRPFRVNAGAVHSYVWAPNNMTSYITELKAGSKVLVVDTEGNTREISVGRVKIEVRPLLKIAVEVNGEIINTIVQDDWHIRIFGANGEPRNASTIKVGEELLVYSCTSGRHVGIKIEEQILEV